MGDEQYKQEQEPRNLQECKDVTGRFTVIGVGKRRCHYAKFGNRCAHEVQGGFTVADKCPETCEACPADEEEEDPIIIVTDPPTTSPVNDDTCEDISGKFKVVGIKKWKNCFWARRGNNCNRDLEEGGKVYDICPVTCDACPVTIVTDPPTKSPTKSPTSKPTSNPTSSPTSSPSSSPTSSPTSAPSDSPTSSPTESPTMPPTLPATIMVTECVCEETMAPSESGSGSGSSSGSS